MNIKKTLIFFSIFCLAPIMPALADNSTLTPTAEWKLDERAGNTARDSVGNNDLLGTNSVNWSAGRVGWSLSLNGLNAYLKNGRTENIGLPASFSIVGWVNPDILPQQNSTLSSSTPIFSSAKYYALLAKGENGKRGFEVNFKNNYLNLSEIGRGVDITSTATFQNSQWQELAITWDSASKILSFYKNGSLTDTINVTEAILPPEAQDNLVIGSDVSASDHFFSGFIDEVKIYNQALTSTEIQKLYADSNSVAASTNLLATIVSGFSQLSSIAQGLLEGVLRLFGFFNQFSI